MSMSWYLFFSIFLSWYLCAYVPQGPFRSGLKIYYLKALLQCIKWNWNEIISKNINGLVLHMYDYFFCCCRLSYREELIEYYRLLSETAAARERRALWRIRRHQLSEAREQWLVDQENEIQLLLQQQEQIGLSVRYLLCMVVQGPTYWSICMQLCLIQIS